MQKNILMLMVVALGMWTSCAEDKDLGPDVPFGADYTIPQGKSPADDRVVELFEKYGTYFLYDYTEADFYYTIVASSANANITTYRILGDPQYMGDMLDLLNDVWLKFYPKEFLAENLPYRVLVADTIKEVYSYVRPDNILRTRLTANTMAVAGMNKNTKSMPADEKRKLKNELQKNFFTDLVNNGKLELPKEFYEVSDYSKAANTTPESADYARTRGFVPSIDYEDLYGTVSEWCTYVDYKTKRLSETTDIMHFLKNMLCHAEDDPNSWGTYLTYPLVQKKHKILRDHFIAKYGVDIQAIGNGNK